MRKILQIIQGLIVSALGLLINLLPKGTPRSNARYLYVKLMRSAPLSLIIGKGDTVVQVGAIAKGEVFPMAKIVGPHGRIIVIEPDPDNIKAIQSRLEEECINNVIMVTKGAWGERGKQTLLKHPTQTACSRIELEGIKHDRALRPEEYEQVLEIEVDRLDNILADLEISNFDCVKITVMGVELEVLKGMDRILQGNLQLWVKGHALKDGYPTNKYIASMLSDRGCKVMITKGTVTPDGLVRAGDVYALRNSKGNV